MIALIAGNRPQYIKAEIILSKLKCTYIDTGQHYGNMASPFIKTKPDYSLGVHGSQLKDLIPPLSNLLEELKPSLVVVIGDTNTTLAGALVAKELKIPIAHIESGLRCFEDIPEESNRVIVDHIAEYHFCPTRTAIQNLEAEGIFNGVYNSGDVMAEIIKGERDPQGYVLATIHRQGNVDTKERLQEIVGLLRALKDRVIWPLHPRTKKMLDKFKISTKGLEIIEPVSFEEMIELERKADRIITDSGGVMREAYLLNVPCLVLRDSTEWEELKTGEKGLLGSNASDKIAKILGGL